MVEQFLQSAILIYQVGLLSSSLPCNFEPPTTTLFLFSSIPICIKCFLIFIYSIYCASDNIYQVLTRLFSLFSQLLFPLFTIFPFYKLIIQLSYQKFFKQLYFYSAFSTFVSYVSFFRLNFFSCFFAFYCTVCTGSTLFLFENYSQTLLWIQYFLFLHYLLLVIFYLNHILIQKVVKHIYYSIDGVSYNDILAQ